MAKSNKVPRFARNDFTDEALIARQKWIEDKIGVKTKHISSSSIKAETMKGNIEYPIGVCQVPLGLVGPLAVDGEYARGEFYVPMATTEGALLLDYQLGAALITSCGGAKAKVLKDQIHISPLFYVDDVDDADNFIDWIRENFTRIKTKAQSTTNHGELLLIEPIQMPRRVVLKFVYVTGDAHGLNMINKATKKACDFIAKELNKEFILRSHYSSIKGASSYVIQSGQAKSVISEVFISADKLSKYFRVSPDQVVKYFQSAILAGIYSGRTGANCHFANGIAAIFLACGQDIADVSLSHVGVSNFETTDDGRLYCSVHIPNLFIGTVGGGTGLGTQREALEIMGCYGSGKINKFAEIIAATILAGEITVIASLVNGNYVNAHEKYGRNRP